MYGIVSTTFAVVWTVSVGVSISSTAAIGADGSLWFGSDATTLYCITDPSPSGSPTGM